MKTITIYEYDQQLRPGTLGVDFEDENPNNQFTLQVEKEDGEVLMRYLQEWFYGEHQ